MIKTSQLSKYYGTVKAVDNLTIHIKKHEITAFIGPNGAGKTTTMKLLTQTIHPSSGEFWVDGKNVYKELDSHERQELRSRIGYLAENNPVYPDFLVGEFLILAGQLRGLKGKKLKSAFNRVATQCRLENVLKKPIHALSKGYRQRVGVAQALIHDPDILFLDEPTSGLDPNQTGEFLSMLKDMTEKTILFSTHLLLDIPQLCQDLILINEGVVAFQGTPKDFLAQADQDTNMDRAFRTWTEKKP